MSLCVEYGYTSLNHVGEELCGDNVECNVNKDYTTLVLADGLGSGVKANILSTLTAKILCTMVSNNIPIEECVETIIQSLPVCKVRGVAYSTFSVIHIDNNGDGSLFEFDNPQAIYYTGRHCQDLNRTKIDIQGKDVFYSKLSLHENDMLLVMSDGTIHAGIGQILNFGWQRPEIIDHLNKNIDPRMSARCVAHFLASACNDLYMDKPGDDTTVAAIKLRQPQQVSLLIGPPVNKEQDQQYVNAFMAERGKKIVCGGTSSQIVARCLNKKLRTSCDFPDRDIPPIGYIDGIDLTTEGVITMRRVLELSEKYISVCDLTPKRFEKKDGASLIAQLLFEEATDVKFYVGQNINAAHQGLPIDTTMKLKLIETLSNNLKLMGKQVTVTYY